MIATNRVELAVCWVGDLAGGGGSNDAVNKVQKQEIFL